MGGSEGPAQQRREEFGGGAVEAGQQAQAGPGGTRGGLPEGGRGDQNRLRSLERSPGPPQGAPEVLVAGGHLLQQVGDVESSGTHAGCAAGCGRERIWRRDLPSPSHAPSPFGHACLVTLTPSYPGKGWTAGPGWPLLLGSSAQHGSCILQRQGAHQPSTDHSSCSACGSLTLLTGLHTCTNIGWQFRLGFKSLNLNFLIYNHSGNRSC